MVKSTHLYWAKKNSSVRENPERIYLNFTVNMNPPLNKETLEEYGFRKVEAKSKGSVTVFSRNKVEIAISDSGSVYYSNMGFDYPLADLAALKKLYKELRRVELSKA